MEFGEAKLALNGIWRNFGHVPLISSLCKKIRWSQALPVHDLICFLYWCRFGKILLWRTFSLQFSIVWISSIMLFWWQIVISNLSLRWTSRNKQALIFWLELIFNIIIGSIRVGKHSAWAIFQYFQQFKEIQWPCQFRLNCPEAIQSLLSVPMCQAHTGSRILAPALLQMFQQNESRMFRIMLRVEILSVLDHHWWNSRKIQEKHVCQSTDGQSWAWALEKLLSLAQIWHQ